MESIIARALDYTLKYWLKSFSRDQFKLQGRTAQLSNLDINGDALHASLGLPPALNVTTAKVGKLEIVLPYMSNIQVEPIVVQIDKLDVVLEENDDIDESKSNRSTPSPTSSGKGSGYGFADKIADGMTLEVGTVNFLLETHGGARHRGGATWASPMASITIRNLLLYTTNESWKVVNLKEARDFPSNEKFIYVFKKLQWEYLSIDLLPHPDMFIHFANSEGASDRKDDDGAKRVFFGGERFIEGVSGEAYITIQRTELNSPLGLELQLHITEAVCPALSEPGLRALLRFFTGLYVCLNRGDVNPNAQQRSTEAAGRTLVSVLVDHIFLCIKDAEFQLELLMQSLFFSRASVSDGENAKNLNRVMIGGIFLRDTFERPPCTLVQPLIQDAVEDFLHIPDFGKDFCPPIYPLGDQLWKVNECTPLISLHSLQFKPSPSPPSFASQTVIECQPLLIHLQEESCLRISSFLADGLVVNPDAVSLDFSVHSLLLTVKGLDITVPLETRKAISDATCQSSFTGARLHIENFSFSESPSLKLRLLNLEKDPACFCLWEDQPIDASQKKWTTEASLLSMSLETCNDSAGVQSLLSCSSEFWKCVEVKGACIQVAMATADGSPLINVPPPGGVVRIGVACEQYLSNTSVEQLFFVLDLYAYFGDVSEKISVAGKDKRMKGIKNEPLAGSLNESVPGDTAVSLAVKDLKLRFLESSSIDIQGTPLVQFVGEDLLIKVGHRTLGGAMAISSSLRWDRVEVDCADVERNLANAIDMVPSAAANGVLTWEGHPQLRAVFWVQNKRNFQSNGNSISDPFLNLSMVHVIPYSAQDIECHSLSVSACFAGVRLGGGLNYAEALLHRFGILGPDGGPGEGLSKGLDHLSAGPLSKLFKASPLIVDELRESKNGSFESESHSNFLHLGTPDDMVISIELKDWLFALEGAEVLAKRWWFSNSDDVVREERCWHTTFQSLQVKAISNKKDAVNGKGKLLGKQKHPVELVTMTVEGLKTLKPQSRKNSLPNGVPEKGLKQAAETDGGINFEVDVVISESEDDNAERMIKWVVENLKFSVKQPIEAVVTNDELQHLALLCKSEIDSVGRITAGVLRLLKLEGSVGQAAIDQLSNLGSEGFDKIFTPEKSSRGSSISSIGPGPSSKMAIESPQASFESTLASLEVALLDSQNTCEALTTAFGSSESPKQHVNDVKQLTQKLESMQRLMTRLRTQI